MVHRYRAGNVPAEAEGGHPPGASSLGRARDAAGPTIDTALADFDFRNATAAVVAIAKEANRFIEATTPWKLVKAEGAGAAARILAQCGNGGTTVAAPEPGFPRLELA